MKRMKGIPKKSVKEGVVHKWTPHENDVLMKIRGRFLDKNGRVAKGSWATICEEAVACIKKGAVASCEACRAPRHADGPHAI